MGVQLNHSNRIFHYKPSICGTPPFMEPPIYPLVKQLKLDAGNSTTLTLHRSIDFVISHHQHK